jgi:hypothetical protein
LKIYKKSAPERGGSHARIFAKSKIKTKNQIPKWFNEVKRVARAALLNYPKKSKQSNS